MGGFRIPRAIGAGVSSDLLSQPLVVRDAPTKNESILSLQACRGAPKSGIGLSMAWNLQVCQLGNPSEAAVASVNEVQPGRTRMSYVILLTKVF